MNTIPQFGQPLDGYKERPSAYAVVWNGEGEILVVDVNHRYHLPGGGIDAGEDPLQAVEREILEETGYRVEALQYFGRANQFVETKDLGPINKLGTYFTGRVINVPPLPTSEADHKPCWIIPQKFLISPANDVHKWAVRMVVELNANTNL